jgi:hypothetical protein
MLRSAAGLAGSAAAAANNGAAEAAPKIIRLLIMLSNPPFAGVELKAVQELTQISAFATDYAGHPLS